MFESRRNTFIALLLAVLIGAGGMYAGLDWLGNAKTSDETAVSGVHAEMDSEAAMEKFAKAFEIILASYVEGVDASQLVEGAITGMLETLDDPYSVYMDKETSKQFEESLGSHFSGIGAEVSMSNGKVTIVAPFKDSPAEKAGILPNDRIILIDGNSIEGLSLNEAVLKIRGEKGTAVKLTIERSGLSQTVDITVVRDDIPIETVRQKMFTHDGKNIGLIEITSFSEDTAKEFSKALSELESKSIDGLIIDVRGNPGGYLNSVEDIGKMIIPKDKPIVQTEDREGKKTRYLSNLKEVKPYPIIGLIDKGSASASEILAGALKEAGNYELVGVTTFGKGTVQQQIKLGDGSQMKLSLYKWLTSDGNFIHKVGVTPTVEVMQPDYFYLPPLQIEEKLSFDMANEQVKNAQAMLKGLGFEPGRTDGYFGEQTKQAVKAFQQTHGLPLTGEIDDDTASAIHKQLIENIRDEKNDRQLQTAIEMIVKGK